MFSGMHGRTEALVGRVDVVNAYDAQRRNVRGGATSDPSVFSGSPPQRFLIASLSSLETSESDKLGKPMSFLSADQAFP